MTVKQLIRKLMKYPEDATVLVHNNDVYLNGFYHVTSKYVEHFDDNTVVIGTDYKKKED